MATTNNPGDSLHHTREELLREIAERQRAEETLRESEARFRTMAETIPALVAIFQGTRQVYVNRAMSALTGYSQAELLAMTFLDFVHADFQELVVQRSLARQRGEPVPTRYDIKIVRKDGTERWLDFSAATIEFGGKPAVLGVALDVTEHKQAEAELEEAKNAAVAANQSKSEFLANVSHEVRTPINAVIGMTELVLGTELTGVQADYLKMVHDSAESLLAIINDLLDFSKIEAGKLQLDCREFDVRECLGDAVKSLAFQAHGKGLELICRFDPAIPQRLIGDDGRLRQVLVNLVGNAVKFTEQGEVFVDVSVDSRDREQVTLHCTVTDTGIGIPLDKLRSIFGAFEQADNSTTRRYGGTGLGLAIASKLVALMRGAVWCDSEIGRGSCFHATARLQAAAGAGPSNRGQLAERLRGSSVFVIDDNAATRRVLDELLAGWGLSVIGAESMSQALDFCRASQGTSHPVGILLVDADLPDVDVNALADVIRDAAPQCQGIVLMLTATRHLPGAAAGVDVAGAAHVMKPVIESSLFQAMLESFETARGRALPAAANAPANVGERRSLRLLLVEDSLFNQKLTLGQLANIGHTAVVASNGREAVEVVFADRFDAVLMDVQMPEMDGFEAAAAIRKRESEIGGHIPIVAMTARTLPEDREKCLAAGMDAFIAKPVRSSDLGRALDELINLG